MASGLKKSTGGKLIQYFAMSVIALVLIYPVYFMIIFSLQEKMNTQTPALFPFGFHPGNYVLVFSLAPVMHYLLNTLIFLGIGVGMQMVICPLMGYAFARLKAPGSGFIFSVVIFTMMIPAFALLIPQYVFFTKTLKLQDNWLVYVFLNLGGSAYLVFLLRQFFRQIPQAMDEAAEIDGCSVPGIVFRIYLPMSVPILVVCLFFQFTAIWQDYLTSFFYFNVPHFSLATALFNKVLTYQPTGATNGFIFYTPVLMALCVLFTAVPVALFFASQKYLVEGISTQGLKG